MNVSVIIPIWNGGLVITRCLDALLPQLNNNDEVICVDNASSDDSVVLIEKYNSKAGLIRQPVNVGFGGGVNTGIRESQGEILVLLNQDCIVEAGWLESLRSGLLADSKIGIAGCKILNPGGAVNHVGAQIRRPDAYGIHLTEENDGTSCVEYVTGAALAIRREIWNAVGEFDEGFYPAYYEDADYCYRARRYGFEIVCVSTARATHLFSNQAWQSDTIQYAANHHRSRYRFVCKHFASEELNAFFDAELTAVQTSQYFDHTIGRILAARDILRGLPDILARRTADLGDKVSTILQRQLEVGFTSIFRESFKVARHQIQLPPISFPSAPSFDFSFAASEDSLTEREDALWARLTEPLVLVESGVLASLSRQVKRLARTISGQDVQLLSELYSIHRERIRQVYQANRCWDEQLAQALQEYSSWCAQLSKMYSVQTERYIKLLEILVDYDYR